MVKDTTCRECNCYIYSKYGWTPPRPHIDFGGSTEKSFVICLLCFEESYNGNYKETKEIYEKWYDLVEEQRRQEKEANKKICGFMKKDGKPCKREVSQYSSAKHCTYHC
ncbi:hypothetical protein N9N26_00735 [Candidatus Poseidoniales archaeon]|jgi:hypothetical protein|nr:hypothetical protein [Candidatus Poseidoniales archaeon]